MSSRAWLSAIGCTVGFLVGGVGLPGCNPPGAPSADEIARASRAIIDGTASDSEDDAAIAIPLFEGGQFVGACSGVLIAPNVVLTARHCVSQTDQGAVCDSDGNSLYGGQVYADHAASDLGVLLGASLKFEIDAYGASVFTPATDNLCNADISIIVLDRNLTSAPIAQVRLDGPPKNGETFRAVGWGVSNNSNSYGRRRRDDIPVVRVGPAEDNSGLGGIGPNEFEVGESICQGDSGGPAFAETTKAVIGVVSRGGNGRMPSQQDPSAGCTDGGGFKTFNLYTRVDTFADLFTMAFAAAGQEVWHEGGPDPRKAKTGEPCTSAAACRSGICVDGATDAGYCTQACDDTPGACPEGLACEDSDGTKICKIPGKGCAVTPGAPVRAAWGWLLVFAAAVFLRRVRAR